VVELDRRIHTRGVLRRVFTRGLVQEERLTVDRLGRGSEDRLRAQVMIVLSGELRASVGRSSWILAPGDVVAVDRVADLMTHGGEGLSFSVDWTADGSIRGSGRLGPRAVSLIRDIAASLRRGRPSDGEAAAHRRALHDVLTAQGIRLSGLHESPEASARVPDPGGRQAEDQRYMDVMDTVLSDLERGPASADWNEHTGATRRTLTRRTHAVYRRYSLFGMRGRTDWRSTRDHYRLIISTILLTEETATVAAVARAVGYRSAAAMCHAYAQAGLPSPGRVRTIAVA